MMAFLCSSLVILGAGKAEVEADAVQLVIFVLALRTSCPIVPLGNSHVYVAVLEDDYRSLLSLSSDNHGAVVRINLLNHRGNHLHGLQFVVVGRRRAEGDGADVERVGGAGIDGDWSDGSLHGSERLDEDGDAIGGAGGVLDGDVASADNGSCDVGVGKFERATQRHRSRKSGGSGVVDGEASGIVGYDF